MSWAHSPKAGLAFLSLSGTISLFFWYLIDRPAYTGFSMRKLRISSLPFSQVIFFGFCAFAAYAITISAMGYAGAGKVLAVTNLSLLFGSLGGILFFNERSYLLNRVAGLILLVIGITLIKFF
jgi:drug/metabolite transporter (DMT)-like permease